MASSMGRFLSSSLRCAASHWKHPATSARVSTAPAGQVRLWGRSPRPGHSTPNSCVPPQSPQASRDDDVLLPYPARARASPGTARECTPAAWSTRVGRRPPRPPAPTALRAHLRLVPQTARCPVTRRERPSPCAPSRSWNPADPAAASRRRATVEETGAAIRLHRRPERGFFGMETGECLGNVVSGGRR